MHEARKALEKNQLLLDEAMNALEMAKAKVLEAKAQHKLLEEEQGHLVWKSDFEHRESWGRYVMRSGCSGHCRWLSIAFQRFPDPKIRR